MAFKAGAIYAEAVLDAKKWKAGLKDVSRTTKIASAAIAAGFVAVMGLSIKKADEFKRAMTNVATVIDTSVISTKDLTDQIIKLDPALGGSIELTNGLYQAFSAGASTAEEAMETTVEAAMFAKAALTDTNTAVDVLTTAVNAYGSEVMDSKTASDLFFTTIKQGKITGEQLASTIGQSIPLFASTGIEMKELTSGIAAMTKQGISAAESTTQLNAIVNAFIKPSESMISSLKNIGYESGSAFIEAEGLTGALKFMEEATDGDAAAIGKLVPNIRGMKGVMALTGTGAKEFNRVLKEMEGAAGATEEAFEKQEKTMETFKNSLDKLQVLFGEVGRSLLADLVDGLTKTATWFVNLNEGTLDTIKIFLKAGLIIGGLVAGVYALSVAVGILSTAMAFLAANPIVAAVIAIAALTAGVATLIAVEHKKAIDELTEKYGEFAESIGVAEENIGELARITRELTEESMLLDDWVYGYEEVAKRVDKLTKKTGLTREQIIKTGLAANNLSDSMREHLTIMDNQLTRERELKEETQNMLELKRNMVRERNVIVTLAEEEEASEKEITKQLEEQLRLEKERVLGVISDRKAATDLYTKALEESAIKLNIGLISERENLEANIQAADSFVNALISIGYDGADATQIGNQQLQNTLDLLREQKFELYKLEEANEEKIIGLENRVSREQEILDNFHLHMDTQDNEHVAHVKTTNDLIVEDTKTTADEIVYTWQEKFDVIKSGFQSLYDSIFTIGSLYYENELALAEGNITKTNEIKKKQFNAEKLNKVGNIWMSAADAIMGWWKAATILGPIAGPIFAGIMTGITTGVAIAQSALIGKQKFVPEKAFGGSASGLTRINERGGEILNLPDNTLVIPNDISRQIAKDAGNQGNIISVSFAGANINNDMDLEKITDTVIRKIGREMRLVG